MKRRIGRRGAFFGLPLATVLALVGGLGLPGRAAAVPPPNLPLPPCTTTDGVRSGACPAESPQVSGSASGRFAFGGSVVVTTDPTNPVCSTWGKSTGIWDPSPCFARVSTAAVVNCATIDLKNGNRFRELSCAQALYVNTQGLGSLFTSRRPGGSTGYNGRVACGDTPDFNTFIYGGPFTVTESIWTSRAASALPCEVSFTGPRRPDGLYGPTWVKVRVEIGHAVTGDGRSNGSSESAELYIPIDGDLRDSVDAVVSGTAAIQDADWDNSKVTAIYRATVSNRGSSTAESVELTLGLPPSLRFESTAESGCRTNDSARSRGGTITCEVTDLGAGSFRTYEFVLRVVNATDLAGQQSGLLEGTRGVAMQVRATDDTDTTNDRAVVALDIPFRSGSYDQTRTAMLALAPYFDYQTRIRGSACNTYKIDIFNRLEQIRAAHPDVFANLSYGGISSGTYVTGGFNAGHVGVVVYTKGSNFRSAGIIINGTPSTSPLTGVSVVGPMEGNIGTKFIGATTDNGLYLRTPANAFPGTPKEESAGTGGVYGFEGRYGNNGSEFGAGASVPEPPAASCPFAPSAITVSTESPVDLIITNARGQRVETLGGETIAQELDGAIQGMAFPHADGSYGWTLVLPPDDYDVQLRGNGSGPYRLTLTTYRADGSADAVTTSGTTTPGQVDRYSVAAPAVTTPTDPADPTDPTAPASGGGGAAGPIGLLSLLGLLALRRKRKSA